MENDGAGYTINGKINRKDYGVSFSMVSEAGSLLLGEDVSLQAQVQFVKVAEKAEATV